jgi:hypothetical protein
MGKQDEDYYFEEIDDEIDKMAVLIQKEGGEDEEFSEDMKESENSPNPLKKKRMGGKLAK